MRQPSSSATALPRETVAPLPSLVEGMGTSTQMRGQPLAISSSTDIAAVMTAPAMP